MYLATRVSRSCAEASASTAVSGNSTWLSWASSWQVLLTDQVDEALPLFGQPTLTGSNGEGSP